jgi:hypothetical protein
MIKLGYLGTEPYSSKYIPVNKYWTSLQHSTAFSTICYAVRSDLVSHLLKHKWTTPVDHLRIPRSYGMINLEEVLEVPTDVAFRKYTNRSLRFDELFHGMVAEEVFESQIYESSVQKWMICFPGGGITDMLCVISECLAYAEQHNRTLVIDTRKVEWFKESIHDYIEFNHPRIYVGNIDTLYDTIRSLATIPIEVKGNLTTFTAEYKDTQFYYKGTVSTKLDLTRTYAEPVLVFSNCGFSRNFSIIKYIKFKEPTLSVFRERRNKLPERYIGLHVRNTDYKSNVADFLKAHDSKFHAPFFLATDDNRTIDLMRGTYGGNVVSFATIEPNDNGKGLHYKERDILDLRRFIVDSYVDLLLLASSDEIVSSYSESGYTKMAVFLLTYKQHLYNVLDVIRFYNEYHYGDNILNLKFLYNISPILRRDKKRIHYYYNDKSYYYIHLLNV